MPYMMKVDFEPFDGTPFNIAFYFPLGLPGVVNCRFSAGTFVRTPELIKGEEDIFQLTNPKMGSVHYAQRGQQIQLRSGEAILMHGAEPVRFGSSGGFGGIGIIVPRAEFENRGLHPDDVTMQRLTSQCEALRLLKSYVQSIQKSGLEGADVFGTQTALREVVQQHIYELVVLAASWRGAVGESHLNAVKVARLRAVFDYIAAHFDNPQLKVEEVAQHQGVSTRYLQHLLESSGCSYTAVVNEMRLQKAFTLLTATEQSRHSILDIALQAGFSDISYFNRLFRTRFADTPSGVRALSLLRH